jgi:hypothetical protein
MNGGVLQYFKEHIHRQRILLCGCLANSSASLFRALGKLLIAKPNKYFSIPLTVAKYLTNSGC